MTDASDATTPQYLRVPATTRAVCIGSGRFLRAVLVPLLESASGGAHVALFQPRGTDFATACTANSLCYDVDTIHRDGSVTTDSVRLAGVGSLARDVDRRVFFEETATLPQLQFIGIGVTDAGFAPGGAAIRDLAQFLYARHTHCPDSTLSVLNTDNVPCNGDLLRTRVLEADWPSRPSRGSAAYAAFVQFLDARVHFHNTMVDRLTSHRPDDHLVPLAEPTPSKVMAIQDTHGVLSSTTLANAPGVFLRATRDELMCDQKLKLRINNGTNSAIVYLLSLSRFRSNNAARLLPHVLAYRDALFYDDILPSLVHEGVSSTVAIDIYNEWTHRICHAHFGLVNLWVTQNAWFHFTARLFSSIRVNVAADASYRASRSIVFAAACILRFLTPLKEHTPVADARVVYMGLMDKAVDPTPVEEDWVYGDGLRANLSTGTYEFVDLPATPVAARLAPVVPKLQASRGEEDGKVVAQPVVIELLSSVEGFDIANDAYAQFADDVAAMYARLMRGKLTGDATALEILSEVVAERTK